MQTDKEFLDEKDFDFSDDYFEEEEIKNQPEEPYSKDIKKEKPAKKEKSKYVGKTNVVSVQKKRQEEKTAKKLISISEKNKKVLEEMMGESFIIMKSSSDLNIVNTQPNTIPVEPQKEETSKEDCRVKQ